MNLKTITACLAGQVSHNLNHDIVTSYKIFVNGIAGMVIYRDMNEHKRIYDISGKKRGANSRWVK